MDDDSPTPPADVTSESRAIFNERKKKRNKRQMNSDKKFCDNDETNIKSYNTQRKL